MTCAYSNEILKMKGNIQLLVEVCRTSQMDYQDEISGGVKCAL